MKLSQLSALLVLLMIPIAVNISANAKDLVKFKCDQGKKFEVTFAPETAQSPATAKVKLDPKDPKQILVLKQIRSASGARYSDQKTTLFTKGQEAFIEVNNQTTFDNCLANN